ncbi:Peptidase family M23 [Alkalibacterium gilvum]|uniref:Peptidase family M23 n=1 Tax=Alkalibacterium gilvum TaxID=1130080 RepID=A0A1H6U462_9LACT|nr:Peptidase family M23 [Alkalibacterium gilvum]
MTKHNEQTGRLLNRNDKRGSQSVTQALTRTYPNDREYDVKIASKQIQSPNETLKSIRGHFNGRTEGLVLNKTKLDTKRLTRNSQTKDLDPTLAGNRVRTQEQTKQTASTTSNNLSLKAQQTYHYKLERGTLTPKPNKQTVSGQIELKRVTPILLKELPLKSSQPFSTNKTKTLYTIKQTRSLSTRRFKRLRDSSSIPINHAPLRFKRAALDKAKLKVLRHNRSPLTLKQTDLKRLKTQYNSQPIHLRRLKEGVINKTVVVPASLHVGDKEKGNSQGIILDRLTNTLVHDHLEDLDTGYQAVYAANRKRKRLVRATQSVKQFVQSSQRSRSLVTGATRTSQLQAQSLAAGAMESTNPVMDTASTATGRALSHAKTTKEILKKGKGFVRQKQAIKGRNVVRNRHRLTKMKGISKGTVSVLQTGGLSLKKAVYFALSTIQQGLAAKGLAIGGLVLGGLMIFGLAVAGTGNAFEMQEEEQRSYASAGLSERVLQWQETVEKELEAYDLLQYTDLILVLIQLESQGVLPDVMQSSESLGLPPNTIQDPKKSIQAGVAHFKRGVDEMKRHDVDLKTLIQAYNFGNAFIPYVADNGKAWEQSLSEEFSDLNAQKLGWASFGDKDYVSKAMQYLTINDNQDVELKESDLSFDLEGQHLVFPVPNFKAVSSSYGWRTHPITKERAFHTGTDIPAPAGIPVLASANGVVTEAGRKGTYGNAVVIDHGSNVQTLYGHNSSLTVQAGETVTAGQMIARVGNTGRSTGPHLHFEVRHNGQYTNPLHWFK